MEDRLNQLLWGYPKLIGEFYANVEPVLAPNRERIDREREKREARRHRSSTNDDDPPCSPSEDLDERASPLIRPDDSLSPNARSGSSDETPPQVRLKFEFSSTNHPSLSDERQPSAVESEKSDVQDHTTRAQSGSGEAAEAPNTHSDTDHEVSLESEERANNASSE